MPGQSTSEHIRKWPEELREAGQLVIDQASRLASMTSVTALIGEQRRNAGKTLKFRGAGTKYHLPAHIAQSFRFSPHRETTGA